MRTIKFRGKLCHSNEWIIGNLIIANNNHPYIVPSDCIEPDGHHLIFEDKAFWVIPETVGQFTGLTDKNGKDIFEGDFVRQKTNPCSQNKDCIVEPDPLYDRYEIKWDERKNGWNAFPNTSLSSEDFDIAIQQLGGLITWPCEDVLANSWHYEIIGNIHDNPELFQN